MVILKYCFAASDDGKETPVYSCVPNKHVDVYSFSAKVSRPTPKSDELRNEFFPLMWYLWSDKEFLNTKEAVILQWFSELFLKGQIHVFWSGSGKARPRSVQDFLCFYVHSLDRRRSGAALRPSQSCLAEEVSNGQEPTGSDHFLAELCLPTVCGRGWVSSSVLQFKYDLSTCMVCGSYT